MKLAAGSSRRNISREEIGDPNENCPFQATIFLASFFPRTFFLPSKRRRRPCQVWPILAAIDLFLARDALQLAARRRKRLVEGVCLVVCEVQRWTQHRDHLGLKQPRRRNRVPSQPEMLLLPRAELRVLRFRQRDLGAGLD